MFVALEDIDGTGKTTISAMLSERLGKSGIRVYLTTEPTDKFVIDYSTQSDRTPENGISLFFRFTEDRFRHKEEIREKLDEGYLVLTDRYILSSFAYQGALIEPVFGSKEKTVDWMKSVSGIIDLLPDMTFYLDLDVEQAMKRMGDRSKLTGFEEKRYLSRVREYYENLSGKDVYRIDASKSRESVTEEIYNKIMEKM